MILTWLDFVTGSYGNKTYVIQVRLGVLEPSYLMAMKMANVCFGCEIRILNQIISKLTWVVN